MFKKFSLTFVVFCSMLATTHACGMPLTGVPEETREQSIELLRQMGLTGVDLALAELLQIESQINGATGNKREDLSKLMVDRKTCLQAIDKIASQRHAHISRLYWHTDLEQAKAESENTGKPILSLRMLGKLTDEFSCANSRFFRTALYANKKISDHLRENFVLHWKSVRPVPKVTIDFGDGRKVERTVTGNSAHYLLSSNGTPLDVLPGLYSPQEFLSWLKRAKKMAIEFGKAEGEAEKVQQLRKYHAERRGAIQEEWTTAIKEVAPDLLLHRPDRPSTDLIYVDAVAAAHRAMSKAGPELPILLAIRVGPRQTDRMVTDKLWQKLADHYRSDVKLDERSVTLIRAEQPNAFAAGALSLSKGIVEDPILRLVRNFEDSITLDTVRNKFMLEREVHNWFVYNAAPFDFDQLNEKVYAELFLTPSSDPWLGLVPPDTYTALDKGGITPTARLSEIGPVTTLD